MSPILIIAIINALAFAAFGIDKYCAIHKMWRVPEFFLWLLALAGGALGAWIGMTAFHHKTRYWQFVVGIPLIFIIHVILAFVLLDFYFD